MNRREFILGAAASAGVAGCCTGNCACGAKKEGRILFGACAWNPKMIANMKSIGYDFYEASVAAAFNPEKDAEWWKAQKADILAKPLPLRSCNGFLPGKFRITGEHANWAPILDYAETACRRADEVGLKTIVFGSSGARNVPAVWLEGGERKWPKGYSIEDGREQFVGFCKELVKRIAGCKVQVVIEPLCPNESNIMNYVWQGMQVVREVNSYNLKELADLYHMQAGYEPAQSIVDAGEDLKHCHIASWKTRLFPGSDPATVSKLVPYFEALKKIGYTGGVSCECGWGKEGPTAKNLEIALNTMKGLI